MTALDTGFCWTELSTADLARSARFYRSVFGWECVERKMHVSYGRALDYSLFMLGQRNVAGLHAQIGAQRQQGARPAWLSYILVSEVDPLAARAVLLGGKLLAPPLDVADLGRLAILSDPQGARLGLWQGLRLGAGFQVRGEPGCAAWFEHVSGDPAAAARFYSELTGVPVRRAGPSDDRRWVLGAAAPLAGFSPDSQPSPLPPQWVVCFQVDDGQAACEKVVRANGTILMAPRGEDPQVALVRDSAGASFGLLCPRRGGA
jgi:predicted enzyme related to lactoylglutathione lyase